MTPADQSRLRQLLAALDEAGLVALANAGLLRRARKDLELGPITHQETDVAILVNGPDWCVTMPPDGPTKATDNTRATGITRQILTATLYLQQHWLGDETAPTAEPVITGEPLAEAVLSISADELQKWAGKTAFKQVLALCEPKPEVAVEATNGLAIRLVQHGVEARLLPGAPTKPRALLDSFRITGPKSQTVRWVLMAVLGYQASQGRFQAPTVEEVSLAPSGTALNREQLLLAARELFAKMVSFGLAHLSERTAQRLFTLAISAGVVNFRRLELLVKAITDEVELQLHRQASADSRRLFERLVQADALCRALQNAGESPPLALTGRSRSEYTPSPSLELAGLGAFPWQSASGYEGVTCLFWDQAKQRFLSWSASRPVQTLGRFSARLAYDGESLWKAGSPERLCRARLRLDQPMLNPAGRLSGSKDSVATVLGDTVPGELDFGERVFSSWPKLAQYLGQILPLGFRESLPLDRLVVLKPSIWGERVFVELSQELRWTLHDESGLAISLVVPWNGVNEPIVEFLESVKSDRDRLTHVVARVGVEGARIIAEPLSLLSQGTSRGATVLNPGFDRKLLLSKQESLLERLRSKYGRDRIPTTITDEDGDSLEHLEDGRESTAVISKKLVEFEGRVVQVAEGGSLRMGPQIDEFTRQLTELRNCGLSELPATIQTATDLLALGYRVQLYRQATRAALLELS